MKLFFSLIILCFSVFQIKAQRLFLDKDVDSNIQSVTVYTKGAQINRSASLYLAKGNYRLILNKLSPLIDPNSISAKVKGAGKLLSVQHQYNYLNQEEKGFKIDSIQYAINQLVNTQTQKENRLKVVNQKESVLELNKSLGPENINPANLADLLQLYEREFSTIEQEQSELSKTLSEIRAEIKMLEKQKEAIESETRNERSEVVITLQVDDSDRFTFELSYLVKGAGWYPKYRLDVKSIDDKLQLAYQAEIFQQTAIDWEDVQLTFSNANPNANKEAPILEPWYIDYERYSRLNQFRNVMKTVSSVSGKVIDKETGDPIPGVNIVVQGTSLGTTTDIQGNFNITLPNDKNILVASFIGMKRRVVRVNQENITIAMQPDVQQLSEVVVTGYAKQKRSTPDGDIQIRGISSASASKTQAEVIQRQTTVEFQVDEPYSIVSGSPRQMIDLNEYSIEAEYQYVSVPKLDKKAYLVANIANWDRYDLLEGEAKIFFDKAYVGSTVLNANNSIDTLALSLGDDQGIQVDREKVEQFSDKKFLGGDRTKKIAFKISIKNTKNKSVKLMLYDQVPVSIREGIDVELLSSDNANYNKKTGDLLWNLNLAPSEFQEINFSYQVSYPKDEKIILE